MHAATVRQDDAPPSSTPSSPNPGVPAAPGSVVPLPARIQAAVWRADALGTPLTAVLPSGWPELDRELPGGGWPCHSLTEILCPQGAVLEWRLVGPALRQVAADGRTVVLVGPPRPPHPPGLAFWGIGEDQLVWVSAATPAERLWCTEQLVKANAAGALLAWLPKARPEQIRRLQVCAQRCEGLVFLFRPQQAAIEASAAPLRVHAAPAPDWALQVRLVKRRGALLEAPLALPSVPGGLDAVLTPRLRQPGSRLSRRKPSAEPMDSQVEEARLGLAKTFGSNSREKLAASTEMAAAAAGGAARAALRTS